MSDAGDTPLCGLRVLDLSSGIAGAYCTKLLVDAGADVVKAEPPGGDPLRCWSASGAALARGEDGALFQFLNASKRGTALDLDAPGADAALRALVRRSDLVVESFAPAEARRRALDPARFREAQRALCWVSITPWGRSGPWADRPATEFTLQAATGSVAYRGLPERGPVAAGGSLGCWIAGAFAAVGGLAAWLWARRSGEGRHVDLSTFEAMLLCLTIYHDLDGQWFEGPLAQAIEIPSIEPARDGWIGFCTITGQQWLDFCAMIGRSDLAAERRFLDAKERMREREAVRGAIHAWTRERDVAEILELASAMRIPVAPVGDGRSLPHIEHFAARGIYDRGPGGFLRPRVPYRLERCRPRPFGPAPARGGTPDAPSAAPAPAPPPRAAESDGGLPLAGLRVVDLTAFWAGPFATCTLAALGADVVKVESIQRPDGMRFAGAVPGDRLWEWSPVFAGANNGKRDVTLKLDSPDGAALLRRLVAGSDVVIENYSPRVVESFGLGWEAVHALNPRAVMVRMPAFGLDGPWRDRTGFAMTIEQASGLAWLTGYPDMPLVVRGACDPIGGAHAVFALLLALEHRRRSGEGQLVEVPLVEAALNISAEQVIEHSAYGRLLTRDGNRGPAAAPQGLYRCADDGEWVAVAVADDAQWRALRALVGEPDWSDPALDRAAGRRAAHDAIDAALEAWTRARSRDTAVEQLLAAGVPAHAVVNAHFVHPNPQLEHRGFFFGLEHPVTGTTRYPGLPMGIPGLRPRRPPPTLGQHNDEVLGGELGLSPGELAELRAKGVIGERPSFL